MPEPPIRNSVSSQIQLLAPADAPSLCEPILRSVPEWFGIESATQMYLRKTSELPTWLARVDSRPAGFVTIARPFPKSADVFCMAVHRDFHGRGVGTTLIRHAESDLRRAGVEYLQVKTMGPSKPNAEYALTKKFYEKVGFVPLEELTGLWPGMPCLILVKRI